MDANRKYGYYDFVVKIVHLVDADDNWTPKEVAVTCLDRKYVGHWIIKSEGQYTDLTASSKDVVSYMASYHHGLFFTDGNVSLSDLQIQLAAIARMSHRIYTRGNNSALYLEKVMGKPVININDLGHRGGFQEYFEKECDAKHATLCVTHALMKKRGNFICALEGATNLRQYIHSILPQEIRKGAPGISRSEAIYKVLRSNDSWSLWDYRTLEKPSLASEDEDDRKNWTPE